MLKKILQRVPGIFIIIFFSACGKSPASSGLQIVNIHAAASVQPWLADAYACADKRSLTLKINANEPDIYLRLGEPEHAILPMYKIGEEELVVVTNSTNPPTLNQQQIQDLFTGRITNLNQISADWSATHDGQSGDAHLWLFSSGEDMQQVFDSAVLAGIPPASYTRIAASPQEMLNAITNDTNAIGYLPRRWLGTGIVEQATVSTLPVIAILKKETQGAASIISCLQNK